MATAAHYDTRAEAIRAINARNVRAHRTRGFWVVVNAQDGGFTVRWVDKSRSRRRSLGRLIT
jgi:hypothetical protein